MAHHYQRRADAAQSFDRSIVPPWLQNRAPRIADIRDLDLAIANSKAFVRSLRRGWTILADGDRQKS
jgi:hypothetical protein